MATEKRLIDFEVAMNATYEEVFWTDSEKAAVRHFLAKLPKADAVEVVRCKDCKHYLYDDFDGCYVCMQLSKYVKTDFWCAYGERKDND